MTEKYADIIIDISHEALDKVFQYRVPFSIQEEIVPGTRVIIPFGRGNREREGYVISLKESADYPEDRIKEIIGISPGTLTMESRMIELAAFLKYRYGSSMYQALRTVMPVKRKVPVRTKRYLTLCLNKEEAEKLLEDWKRRQYRLRSRLLEDLLAAPDHTISRDHRKETGNIPLKELKKLEDRGILKISSRISYRSPFSSLSRKEDKIILNPDQEKILLDFIRDYSAGVIRQYLLHGVTGSGKTEVYMAMIEEVLRLGRQAIVLIPEISLTFQTVRRFYERFGEQIAVIHSRMSQGEKSDSYMRIEAGEAKIVIGPRSALFAPVRDLGLIVIDEEHDGAYKSDSSPKYHARETAVYLAEQCGASLVLGSATPSVETYTKALSGEYKLWTLKKRGGNALLPRVTVVDLKEEFRGGNHSIFSGVLREKMEEKLKKKEQIMLFLNRRGYAGFVSCRACGTVMKCPHCDISLTFHRDGSLRCHYCGYSTVYSRRCPVCGLPHVAAFGLGTEKVEAALLAEFPEAKVLRMDTDTTRRKNAHRDILDAFSEGEADILLGTQMIVKGHDYPNVTLVGILAADLSLHARDYRSGERTFQLLCQAAGRAGRGDKSGEVIIQTYSPDHYAITSAADQSYEHFYEEEAAYRRLLSYPPWSHLLVLLVQSGEENQAALAVQRIQKMIIQSQKGLDRPVTLLNPGKASLSKLTDSYRQVLYLKHEEGERLLDLKERLEPVLDSHPLFAGVSVQFDFDPMQTY